MRLIKKIWCAVTLILFMTESVAAQTVALSDDPDFIHSSLLITSTGSKPYQITGHAAIRMQCPQYGFDRVFSFGNNSHNRLDMLFIEGAKGKVYEMDYDYYILEPSSEGRRVTEYMLNLSLDEKARLWEALDLMKEMPEREFNIIDSHCFSVISEAIETAVAPDLIDWDGPISQNNTYSENTFASGGDNNLWNYLMVMLTLNSVADTSGNGKGFVYPTTFEMAYNQFQILSPDGNARQLIVGKPEILVKEDGHDRPVRPSPMGVALIVLAVVLVVTLLQTVFHLNWPAKVADIILWIGVTVGGIFIVFITYAPHHYGGNWNWTLIVMNPIAWLPIVLFRQNKNAESIVWAIYTFVLLVFTVFIGIIAPSVMSAWRVLALALAIRCGWHLIEKRLKNSCFLLIKRVKPK